jgi:hypothetical protein
MSGVHRPRPRSPPPAVVPATLVTLFSYRYSVPGLDGLQER